MPFQEYELNCFPVNNNKEVSIFCLPNFLTQWIMWKSGIPTLVCIMKSLFSKTLFYLVAYLNWNFPFSASPSSCHFARKKFTWKFQLKSLSDIGSLWKIYSFNQNCSDFFCFIFIIFYFSYFSNFGKSSRERGVVN